MIGSKTNHCLFCKISSENTHKIYQTKNFYLITDGAPLGSGHLLLIPKEHLSCFGALSEKFNEEFSLLQKKVISFLEDNFGRTILFEHGVFGQTVHHAHLHFLPTEKKVLPFAQKKYEIKKIKSFWTLKDVLKKDKGYLFFQEDKSNYIIKIKNPPAGFFHTYLLTELLGVPADFDKRAKKAKNVYLQAELLWKDTEN